MRPIPDTLHHTYLTQEAAGDKRRLDTPRSEEGDSKRKRWDVMSREGDFYKEEGGGCECRRIRRRCQEPRARLWTKTVGYREEGDEQQAEEEEEEGDQHAI